MVDNNNTQAGSLGRRDLLRKSVLVGTAAGVGIGISGTGTAAEETDGISASEYADQTVFSISQPGKEHTYVSPAADVTSVEGFYGTGDARTGFESRDTSTLLLVEEPDGTIGLVIIHDHANNSAGGGEATLEFEGLPDDGEWVIKDDTGDQFNETTVSWKWVSNHTDGGAFKDISDATITIAPNFERGITDWVVHDGCGGTFELDMESEVTIQPATSEPIVFDYTNDEQVVDREGLNEAVTDYQNGDIDRALFKDIVDAFQQNTKQVPEQRSQCPQPDTT